MDPEPDKPECQDCSQDLTNELHGNLPIRKDTS